MESSKDLQEDRGQASFVAFGIIIGASLGAVLFAITRNTIWVAILPGLGVVVGSILEANRR